MGGNFIAGLAPFHTLVARCVSLAGDVALTENFGQRRAIPYMERNSMTEFRRRQQRTIDAFWRSFFWWAK